MSAKDLAKEKKMREHAFHSQRLRGKNAVAKRKKKKIVEREAEK